MASSAPFTSEDTIAAISTPRGEGGIGIVRLSGDQAIPIVKSLFISSRGKDIAQRKAGRVFHGEIRHKGEPVEEALVHVMRAPHTYTREDVVEINCHGGSGPLQAVLELCLASGARLAEPGEFTKRAFLNGRLDLVQAEAVIDRIRAQTMAGLRAANAAASGALSKRIHEINALLVDIQAQLEAAIDFPEDELPDTVDEGLRLEVSRAVDEMHQLLATARAGRLYREGAGVAIAGRPNVGKSSLFNALLRDARAIVTSVPGTTRDLLEEVITIEGIPVRLTDTAGLHFSPDEVEQIGIARARETLQNADIILMVLDASQPPQEDERELAEELAEHGAPIVLALNKVDLVSGEAHPPEWPVSFAAVQPLSAATGKGLEELEKTLARLLLGESAVPPDQGLVTRLHQQDSLRRACAALEQVLDNFGQSPELLSVDVREAQQALGEITGETTPDDVLDRIFSAFCIGK